MKNFLSFVKKETLHILRDPRTMLIALLMPIVQILLFGFAISTEVNDVAVAVVAPHRTESIRQAVARMEANSYFTFKGYITQEEVDPLLRSSDADAVVVFADDFDRQMADRAEGIPVKESAVQIIADASNTNMASSAESYLQSILLADAATASLAPETRLLFNPQMKSAYNFVPGIMGLIFIIICAILTSVSIVREKEVGTMEVLLVSPVRPIRIIAAKMIPYFALSCLNLASILLMARYVFDVPMSGNIVSIIGISMLYLVLALAIGLLISTVTSKQDTALIISAMLMLIPIIMLSGMIFSIDNLPGILQALSVFVPARWYVDAMRKLMIEGAPFMSVMTDFVILLVMTVALIGIALKNFNDKLE